MSNMLLQISDPTSPKYGQHLTLNKIKDLFGPSNLDVEIVTSYLSKMEGVMIDYNNVKDLLRVTATIGDIQKLMKTKISKHTHKYSESKKDFFRIVSSCHIPSHVANVMSFISLNTPLMNVRMSTNNNMKTKDIALKQKINVKGASSISGSTTPSVLSSLYNIPFGNASRHGATQAVAEFYGDEFYSDSDLTTFLKVHGLPNAAISGVYGNLPNDPSRPGMEANLDVQYIMGVAPGIPTYFYSMRDLNPYDSDNEGFLAYLFTVDSQADPPLVHSVSYGDLESSVFIKNNPSAIDYGNRVELEFLKLGLRGLTILYASGDDGSRGYTNAHQSPPNQCTFRAVPEWPGSSPYVTSVGATQLCSTTPKPSTCAGQREVACSSQTNGLISSGSGFSDQLPRSLAPWQEAAVQKYLNQASKRPPTSYFNVSGRGYPDISALGNEYEVTMRGRTTLVWGTSASAPVIAAMVSLLNDQRLARGLPPMGFINPFLYAAQSSHPNAFFDVITGSTGCSSSGLCCPYAFSAAPGWDATTGLGSPNFDVLLSLALSYTTKSPMSSPSSSPSLTSKPSKVPSTSQPTVPPTSRPSIAPLSSKPTSVPSSKPATLVPTGRPSTKPKTGKPSSIPTSKPSVYPSIAPVTKSPSMRPTFKPVSVKPTFKPSSKPSTKFPTSTPTSKPSSRKPTQKPLTFNPTKKPSIAPVTKYPSIRPSVKPIS